MQTFILYYDQFYDAVYFLHKSEIGFNTTIIYGMQRDEFIQKFKINEDTIKKGYRFAKLETQHLIYQQVLDNIDKQNIIFIDLVDYTKTHINGVKITFKDVINKGLDYNSINDSNPLYIDINKYVDKGIKENKDQIKV